MFFRFINYSSYLQNMKIYFSFFILFCLLFSIITAKDRFNCLNECEENSNKCSAGCMNVSCLMKCINVRSGCKEKC